MSNKKLKRNPSKPQPMRSADVQKERQSSHQPSDMWARICVIPLRPEKRAYSCQAVQDGGAPFRQERASDNKLNNKKATTTTKNQQRTTERQKGQVKVGDAFKKEEIKKTIKKRNPIGFLLDDRIALCSALFFPDLGGTQG